MASLASYNLFLVSFVELAVLAAVAATNFLFASLRSSTFPVFKVLYSVVVVKSSNLLFYTFVKVQP